MKSLFKISALIATVLLAVQLFSGCSKGSDPTPKIDSVETSDGNGLQRVITIPNGGLVQGTLPSSSGSSNSPQIINYQSSASTSAGSQLILPIQFSASNQQWKYIFIQVLGATNGYFKITNPTPSTIGSSIVLPVNIPGYVLNGPFTIQLSIVDMNNNVSDYKEMDITVKTALDCSDASASGSEGLTFTQINMGTKAGTATLSYSTYSLKDRIDIFQGNTWLGGTGTNPGGLVPPLCDCDNDQGLVSQGFVGGTNQISFNYNPSKGNKITVIVSGCLGRSTAWDWYLECPQ